MNFIKMKKKIITTLIFILVLNVLSISTYGIEKAPENGVFEITTNFGIDGRFKPMASTVIEIDVKNNLGEDFSGEIQVLVPNSVGNLDSYEEKIEINKDKTNKIFMPINQVSANKKIKVRINKDSNKVFEQEVSVNAKETQYGEALIGVLADDKKNLSYLENINTGGMNYHINSSSTVNISKDLLESNYKNLQSLDIIVINDYNTSKLSQKSLDQLNLWLNNGGILLIGGTEKTLNNLDNNFLNVDITTPKNIWYNLKEGGITLPTAKLTGNYGDYVIGDSNKYLAASQKRGVGDIVITTFDLANKNFYEFAEVQGLLVRMLEPQLSRKFNWSQGYGEYPYDLTENLRNLEVTEKIDVNKVMIILLVFIFSISFGGYFLFKLINKREFLWFVIPILSIAFTFIMYSIATEYSLKDRILNSVNIINVDSKGNGKMNSFMAIGNKYASNLVIEEPEGTRVQYIVPENHMQMDLGQAKDKIDIKVLYDGDKTYYDFEKVSALDLKTFNISGKEGIYNPMQYNLNYLEDGITGTITNPYEADIEAMFVVFGNNVWDIGKLKKGETFTFDKNEPSYVGDIGQYVSDFEQSYYEEYWNKTLDKNIDKYKGKMRDYKFARYASYTTTGEAYCLAITKENINYGFNFENEDISKFSRTAYINQLNINFKDNEGNTNFPLGYIKGEIESTGDQIGIDTFTGRIWGKGEVVLNYNFEEKFIPSTITFKCPPIMNEKGHIQPFKGSMQIYNFKTEKFEDVNFSNDTPYQMTSFTNYIKDNQLKVKIIGKDEQDAQGPMISVKGRYKQ